MIPHPFLVNSPLRIEAFLLRIYCFEDWQYLLRKLVLCWIAFTSLSSQGAEGDSRYQVLLIYGTPDIGAWEQSFNDAFLNALPDDIDIRVTLEFLSLISPRQEDLRSLAESVRIRQDVLEADLVIGVQPGASSFLKDWGDVFAEDKPRLYILPGDDVLASTDLNEDTAVLRSAIASATTETIELMPELLPNLENVFVLGGSGDGDGSYMEIIRNAISTTDNELTFQFLIGLTPEELREELGAQTDNSAILMSTYNSDAMGSLYRSGDMAEILNELVEMPVFGLYDSILGKGAVVGGSITSAALYGAKTSQLGAAMLQGNLTSENSALPTEYIFDASQMNRFGVVQNRLPASSRIINDDTPWWRQNLLEILSVLSVILIQLILIVALLISIRKRKEIESELREAHKMEALGTLSGGIAHDFNNILMAIVGNAEIANSNVSNDPVAAKTYISKILKASDRAKSLINQILLFSRGAKEKKYEVIDLIQLLDETAAQIKVSAPDSVSISLSRPHDLWGIEANGTQIQQALMNLSVNALHAMNNQGSVEISAHNLSLGKPRKIRGRRMSAGDYVVISITDSGCGIDPEDAERVFEPFFTTKSQGEGTGLGLALVYGIVKSHDAFLDFESEARQGTTFKLYFSAVKNKIKIQDSEAGIELHIGNKELVLLVDDDQLVLDAMALMLTQLGYEVEAYSNSMLALNKFKGSPEKYDLVISDLSMPDIDGLEMLSAVMKTRADTPAILCTGYLDTVKQRKSSGLDSFILLNKPCSLEDLSEACATALSAEQVHC